MSNYLRNRNFGKLQVSSILESYYEDEEAVGGTLNLNIDQEGEIKSSFGGSPMKLNIHQEIGIRPVDIIKKANILVSMKVNSCLNSDELYLELLNQVLSSFLVDAVDKNFNFLLENHPIYLDKNETYYELPSNFHTQSNLFVEKGCHIYNKIQRFTFQPLEAWSDTIKPYTYTINGYRLYVKLPERDIDECQKQENIKHLRFEYYSFPDLPTHINDTISWLPSNPSVISYLVACLMEKICEVNNVFYQSPYKSKYWISIVKFATGQNNTNSNRRLGKKFLSFSRYE